MSLLATHVLATSNFGSPTGITTGDKQTLFLWHLTYFIAIPLGLLVLGLIVWCIIAYREKPGSTRRAQQFQYHIPLEALYTIVPLVLVAIVFGFMYSAENKVDHIAKHPAVKITVQSFQWGWRFIYPNGHQEVGDVYDNLNINSRANLPVLYMPAHETVQFTLKTADVVHTFYIPAFLYQRDMYPHIHNVIDFNVTRTGIFPGECNNICGVFHAYMRFNVDVMPVSAYNSWYAHQAPNSITNA